MNWIAVTVVLLGAISASAVNMGFKEIEAITNKMKKEDVVFYKVPECVKNEKAEKTSYVDCALP